MSGPVLITGAGGMVGGAVAAHLRARGAPVAVHAGRADGALDLPGVAGALVDRWAPRVVIHCAGLTYGLPEDLWRANVLAPMRLLDAVARHSPAARLVLVGSSAEYGLTGPGVYLAEDAPCRPDSEYGMSKLATTRLAALSPVATVVARLFNPVPNDPEPRTLLGRVARAYAAGETEPAGAEQVRDFVPIGSAAACLVGLAEAPDPPPLVNICTGVARTAAEQFGRPPPGAAGAWSVGDARLLASVLGSAGVPRVSAPAG